jgi:hypothetical protein
MHENGFSHQRSEVSGRPGVATAYGPPTQSYSHALTPTRLILNIPEFLIRPLPTTEITETYFHLFYKVTIILQKTCLINIIIIIIIIIIVVVVVVVFGATAPSWPGPPHT